MTFCLGIHVQDGLIGIADTRIVSGNEFQVARKFSIFQGPDYAFFTLTSGLRSVRDKSLAYFDDAISDPERNLDRLYKAVNLFTEQLRRVADEDQKALEEAGFKFNFHALIGGQMAADPEPRMYLVYPEGNWVQIQPGTPYQIIGASGYGKPILARALRFHDSMEYAFKVGVLAFDSTRLSASDVGFPIDVLLYLRNSFRIVEYRYFRDDLLAISEWWQDRLRLSVDSLPSEWVKSAFSKLTGVKGPNDRALNPDEGSIDLDDPARKSHPSSIGAD
jgi:putative proteasome-type protease